MDFTGKTCVVTGGANGIGRCIVESFVAAGAKTAFIDTDGAAGRKLARRLGENALFIKGDIANQDVLRAFAEEVAAAFGMVNVLVNNACLSKKGLLSGCGYHDFTYVLRIGVTAPYMLAQLFMNDFAPNAAIVNIASTRTFMSQADTESYAAAKGGIMALTHALAASLAGKVRVNAVSPGWIETAAFHENAPSPVHSPADEGQHFTRRVGAPKDIAAAVMFLCSEEAGFITGQNITVDGGISRRMIYHGDEGWAYSPE